MKSLRMGSIAVVLALCPALGQAQEVEGYRGEALRELDRRAERLIALADAIPAETYTWRPAEGVRSVSEVFLHLAGAQYYLFRFAGVEMPEDFNPQGFDTSTTDKEAVIAALRRGFEHGRQAIANAPDDPTREVDWFGGSKLTHRAFLLAVNGHVGEHLGQMIAYARMNSVVPPWSQ